MYLTYEEYRERGGNLTEAAFSRFAFGEEQTVRGATFGRVDRMREIPESVKWLVFELVGIAEQAEREDAKLTSEKVGEWSKSYAVETQSERQAQVDTLIRRYLAAEADENGIPLLYLGVDA